MLIRPERPADADTISLLINAAFAPRAYDAEALARIADSMAAAGIDPEAMAAAQAESTGTLSEAEIVLALRDDGALAVSLVAEVGGAILGHIAFSPATIADKSGSWFALAPVSVLPAHQRQGIGGALIREGLARLANLGAHGCVLIGYPPYYERFGFSLDDRLTWRGRSNPALQRIVLNGEPPVGEVLFHPALESD